MSLPRYAGFAISVVAQNVHQERRVFTYDQQCQAYGVFNPGDPETAHGATEAADWLAQVAELEGYPDVLELKVARREIAD